MNPLARIRRFRHKGLVALFALVALMVASTAYVAHGLTHDKPLTTHSSTQCDLCLHFAGTAGAPDSPPEQGKPPLAVAAPIERQAAPFRSHEHPTHRLPRAPPALI
jgi:hypothetical protein